MKIAFVVARLNDDKNIIQKKAIVMSEELRKLGFEITIIPFKKQDMFWPFPILAKLKQADKVIVWNIGLQAAYYSLWKWYFKKPLIAVSFGSDLREYQRNLTGFFENLLIKLWNIICRKKVDILIAINPDLPDIAKRIGYKDICYINNWLGG